MTSILQVQQPEAFLANDFAADHGSSQASAEIRGNGRPEIKLILACARRSPDDDALRSVRTLLEDNLDWPYIVRTADRHCVTPLLHKSLEHFGPELVPQEFLSDIQIAFQKNALRNLSRTGEMIRMLDLVRKQGAEVLPFKGPLLAHLAYGDLGLRQFGDLDILVHEHDIQKVKNVFLKEGYRQGLPLTWFQTRFPFLSGRKDYVLVKDQGSVVVELHWRLTGKHFPLGFDMTNLWRRLETVSIAGFDVLNLPNEDLLLYLCMHGSRHSWERLAWVCDVAELVKNGENINLEKVFARATAMGVERMFALGLLLAHSLLGAPITESLLAKIQADASLGLLARRVSDLMFEEDRAAFDDISYQYDHHLSVRERLRDRVRLHVYYARRYTHLLLTPNVRDREALSLPSFLSFLYYPVRLLRLIKEYGLKRLKGYLTGFRSKAVR